MPILQLDDPNSMRSLITRLVKTAGVLLPADKRLVRIIVQWIENTLLRNVKHLISTYPNAPVLCMCSFDGWTATVTTHTPEAIGPHVRVDHRGRVRHEFCLERAVIRQRRPCDR